MKLLRQCDPRFTITCLLAVVLAVGANVAVLSLLKATWVRRSPIIDAHDVVVLVGRNEYLASSESLTFTRHGLRCLQDPELGIVRAAGQLVTSGTEAYLAPHIALAEPVDPLEVLAVTEEYFSVLGLEVIGRDFQTQDSDIGATTSAIISDRLWRQRFRSDLSVIGSVLPLERGTIHIVGIAPPDFEGVRLGEKTDVWIPVASVPRLAPQQWVPAEELPLLVIGRLQKGVTPYELERRLTSSFACGAGARGLGTPMAALPVPKIFGGAQYRTTQIDLSGERVLIAMSSMVFLAGIVSLFGAVSLRYHVRQAELATRVSLGATTWSLVRLLVRELALIAALGVPLALLVGAGVLRLVPAISLGASIDYGRIDLSIDWRIVLLGGLLCVAAMLVAALGPIRQAVRRASLFGLASPGGVFGGQAGRWLMAGHCVLVAAVLAHAFGLVRIVSRAYSAELGFHAESTLFLTIRGPVTTDTTAPAGSRDGIGHASREIWLQDLLGRIVNVRGVEAVAIGSPPIGIDQAARARRTASLQTEVTAWTGAVHFQRTGSGYHDALGVDLVAGRWLTPQESSVGNRITDVLVTRGVASHLWGQPWNAVGATFREGEWSFKVVGVIEDYYQGSVRLAQKNAVVALSDVETSARQPTVPIVVRVSDLPGGVRDAIQKAVEQSSASASILEYEPGIELLRRELGHQRFGMWMFGGFGSLALALALVGVRGMVTTHLAATERDAATRLALGQQFFSFVAVTVFRTTWPVVAGSLVGVVVASTLPLATQGSTTALPPLGFGEQGVSLLVISSSAVLTAIFATRKYRSAQSFRVLR